MSNKQSQKEAIFSTIVEVLGNHGVDFTEGMNVHSYMTKEIRAEVRDIIVEGFNNGSIELEATYETPAGLKGYTSGLISNWVRKDTRLNGNTKYEAKNPGSRQGSADPQMKALKTLLSQTTNESDREEIQGYIDERLSVLAASKKKSVPVDFSVLPAELAAKFSPSSSN